MAKWASIGFALAGAMHNSPHLLAAAGVLAVVYLADCLSRIGGVEFMEGDE